MSYVLAVRKQIRKIKTMTKNLLLKILNYAKINFEIFEIFRFKLICDKFQNLPRQKQRRKKKKKPKVEKEST